MKKRALQSMVAVDPGGEHVGWCEGLWDGRSLLVTGIWELTPEKAQKRAETVFPNVHTVVVESFRLYPDKAKMLVGSEMETSQLIGVLKYLARKNDCRLVMQPAAIKKPTLSVLRNRGIALQAVQQRKGGHAKDAEVHMHHHVIRTLKES